MDHCLKLPQEFYQGDDDMSHIEAEANDAEFIRSVKGRYSKNIFPALTPPRVGYRGVEDYHRLSMKYFIGLIEKCKLLQC